MNDKDLNSFLEEIDKRFPKEAVLVKILAVLQKYLKEHDKDNENVVKAISEFDGVVSAVEESGVNTIGTLERILEWMRQNWPELPDELKVKVTNQIEIPDYPQFPDTIKVSNLPESLRADLPDDILNTLQEAVDAFKTLSGLLGEDLFSESRSPKNPIAVRLSDGDKWIESITRIISGTGNRLSFVDGSGSEARGLVDDDGHVQVDIISGGGSGGGVQYTEGDTDESITGNAIMWEDTEDTLRPVSVSKPLPVEVQNEITLSGEVEVSNDEGNPVPVSGTVSVSEPVTVDAENLDIRDLSSVSDSVSAVQSGVWTVGTELSTDDLDTGAGEDAQAIVGIGLAEDGGHVLLGSANPMPISGTVTATIQEPLSIDDNGGSITVDAEDFDIRDLNSGSDSVAAVQSGAWSVGVSGSVTVEGTDFDIRDLSPESDGVLIYGSDDGGTTKRPIKTDAGGAIQVDLEVASVEVTAFPDNEPFNMAQVSGTAVSVNSGTLDNGTQRVTIATDDEINDWISSIEAHSGTIAGDTTSIDGKITACDTGNISGAVTTELDTDDLDTGAGTDTQAIVGVALAEDGGHVLLGSDNPLPVSGTVTATIQEPLSVDDNGGSLTVDNAGLTELAAAINASSQMDINIAADGVGLAQESGGNLDTIAGDTTSIDGKITECDTGSVTISSFPDNEPFDLAQYGGAAVGATNAVHVQPGTGAVFPISDNGSSITVDGTVNVEAEALDIRNLDHSKDTVKAYGSQDQPIKQAAVSYDTVVTLDGEDVGVEGDVAHSGSDSGNPVKAGYKARTSMPTAVSGGDRVDSFGDVYGRVVNTDSVPDTMKKHVSASRSTAGTSTILDPTNGYRFVLCDIFISTDTAMNITVFDGTDSSPYWVIEGYFSQYGGLAHSYKLPFVSSAVNNLLRLTTSAAGNVTVTITYYETL